MSAVLSAMPGTSAANPRPARHLDVWRGGGHDESSVTGSGDFVGGIAGIRLCFGERLK